ncbi:unnamed protein product [Brugia pahangi]|uniref:Oxysterol-binding protein n=1 Tax=Brugia pahangi TaxID=6280 RepID=A0A0N4TBD5_BRUPA|nr:unnamed protein product [Brugia pahangi]
MIYVATFVISTLCNTVFRTCKPFNPLWCETFEFDRMADLGWRAIAEQVSHHPPISAIHAEGNGWILDEDIDVHSQFQATIMKIYPEGTASIFFPVQIIYNIFLFNLFLFKFSIFLKFDFFFFF